MELSKIKQILDKLSPTDTIVVKGTDTNLYCWKLTAITNSHLFAKANGEQVSIPIGDIREINVVKGFVPCSICGSTTYKYRVGTVCVTCDSGLAKKSSSRAVNSSKSIINIDNITLDLSKFGGVR